MKHPRLHKCLCCGELFRADPSNIRHQKYCSQATCRKASKAASQRRWLAKPENRDYFRGPVNVARVQFWRQAPPGYRHRGTKKGAALQADSRTQPVDTKAQSDLLAANALQDYLASQPAILIGLIAPITDSALQEDIARRTRRRLELGRDILSGRAGDGHQTSNLPRAGSPGAYPI